MPLKTSKNRRVMLAVVAALLLLFIWGQSVLPVRDSAAESNWLRNAIVNPLLQLVGIKPVSDHVLRKAAHVAEFFALSLAVTLLWRGKALRAGAVCFAAAFLDETIQLFSDRGAQVRDVWIDLIGVALGAALGWALARRMQKKQ